MFIIFLIHNTCCQSNLDFFNTQKCYIPFINFFSYETKNAMWSVSGPLVRLTNFKDVPILLLVVINKNWSDESRPTIIVTVTGHENLTLLFTSAQTHRS